MNAKSIILLAAIAIAACTRTGIERTQITDVYVDDFGSDDMKTCRPSDVDLSHAEAKTYFLRARSVDHKTIHDHYNFAPCYIEGTLKVESRACDWQIRAGATGHIKCGDKTDYFVCDTCDDLFKPKQPSSK